MGEFKRIKMQLAVGGKMNFTKEDTKVIKGIAIVLMMYHLFAFPDRIYTCRYVYRGMRLTQRSQ